MPNTLIQPATPNHYPSKKSSEPTPTRVQRTPTALTPEQEFAVISQYLNLAVPTAFLFNRHPSPFTFASEMFEPLFSHFSSTNCAFNCLSTTTGLTNFIEAMSSRAGKEWFYPQRF